MASYADYIDALKQGTIYPVARLMFYDRYGQPDFEISEAFLVDGQLTDNDQDGTRRSATITLSNLDGAYDIQPDKIWVGQQVQISAGIRLQDGTDYLWPQGVFYITNPEVTEQPAAHTIALTLMDKWAGLDGTVGGTLDGIYQINPGDNLFTAVTELLKLDRGNGRLLDDLPPILDSSYLTKNTTVTDSSGNNSSVSVLSAPYTLRTEAENSYADVLLGINTMLVSTCGYDTMGYLCFRSANTDKDDTSSRPIAWEFTLTEREFYGATTTYNINEMCNDVRIIGAVSNGVQVSGRATNRNPASDCCVARVGYNTFTETQSKYYTCEQCNELAKYYLRRKTMVQKQVSFTSTPLYHLHEGDLVTILRPEVSGEPEPYLVTGFTLPLGGTGAMTINAVSINDLNIYDNWDAAYSLSVLCSERGALTCTYGDTPVDVPLDNPYDMVEVPNGALITFNTVADPSDSTHFLYHISGAYLNGISLEHTSTSCSFNMPTCDSKVVFYLTATSGTDFTYSYTGTNSVSTVTSGTKTWKVIKFSTGGVLTMDSTQIENGILADIWVRGAGGGANASTTGVNGYDVNESNIALSTATVTITVGTGGIYGASRGKMGGTSSWGTLVQAAGGSAAGSAVSNSGGSLSDIFGLISDTTTGAGGAIGAAGSDGAVWLRIAI